MNSTHTKQQGFTLIEILITALIFSFALLSLTQLQLTANRHANSARLHHIATLQALSILEQMRADRSAVLAGQYNLTQDTSTLIANTTASAVLQQWQSQLANLLPEGQGSIQCNPSGLCELSIFWYNHLASQNTLQIRPLSLVLRSQL